MSNSSNEDLRLAAQELYRELRHRRDTNIKAMTLYMGLCGLVVGWSITLATPLGTEEKYGLATLLMLYAVLSIYHIESHAQAYAQIARVIVNVNSQLGLFDSAYPEEWKTWGKSVPRHSQAAIVVIAITSSVIVLLF